MKEFSILVAIDKNYGIGKDNSLPWHLKADLKHFKNITNATKNPKLKNAVIMGRKTWESLPEKFKPLPNRINIVLTKNNGFQMHQDSVLLAHSLDSALKTIEQKLSSQVENIFVIGGAAIYQIALSHPQCKNLIVTKIESSFECDTYFPDFANNFELKESSPVQKEGDMEFIFQKYQKKVQV